MLADELLIAPSLWLSVRGEVDAVPHAVIEALRQRHRANVIRNVQFRRRLVEVVAALNAHGIEPLLFKGALQLVAEAPRELGGRWMADLDLAVPADAAETASETLRQIGYVLLPAKPFMYLHETPFVHRLSPGPLELHVELGSGLIPSLLSSREAWADSTELRVDGNRARALSPTHQVLHNILHSAVQDLNHAVGGLPLRQLMILKGLEDTLGAAVEWATIRARMTQAGLAEVLRDHLWLAHRLVGLPLRDGLQGDARARLHEAHVLASFGLRWPPEVRRNLRFAFGREYLDSLYGHRNHSRRLAQARLAHAVELIHRDGLRVTREALRRRV